MFYVGFEPVNVISDISDDVAGIVGNEWRQIHCKPEVGGFVGGMAFKERRIGKTTALHGEIVAFPPRDLAVEDAIKSAGQVFMGTDIKADFRVVRHPVEVAPDFAAIEFLRTIRLWQCANRLNHVHDDGNVGVMFVGRVMGVNDLRRHPRENLDEIVAERSIGGILHHFTGVIELDHRTVTTDNSGGVLFPASDGHHLVVGEVRVRSGARASAAVGAGDTAETQL